jgi:beta-galactosidase
MVSQVYAQERKAILLDKDWKFTRQDLPKAESSDLKDDDWETVTVPHDWAIKGPFDKMIDAQTVTVTEDGEKKPALRTGRTGSLPWIGIGWYRKKLSIPSDAKGKRVFIEFDGAMSHAVVYLNGERIGTWPYGYASFSFELTDHIRFGTDNVLAVRLENPEESSRWYPGAGLYRNVRLVYTDPVHVNHWGTYITTPEVNADKAVIKVKTELVNQTSQAQQVQLQSIVLDPSGKQVAVETTALSMNADAVAEQQITVSKPLLWDIKTPRLYKLVSKLVINHKTVDRYESPFGIRTIAFTNNNGLVLNGRQTKIKGVCNHHDLGPLGAAVNYRALERQLELLKAMGCNAIRTSHNPPAPELLELCDKMGFVVMDEAFDEWKKPKCKNGYNKLFDEWAEKDLRAMIRRDRNHPSVVLWSVGNEVQEQKDSLGWKVAKFLVDIAHDEDPTRLNTSAFNSLPNAIKNGLAETVDVVGFNYWTNRYAEIHKSHPNWKLLGSETQSAVSSRGEYMFPVVERKSYKYKNLQSSSYDEESPSWGVAPDIEFAMQDENPFVAGEFVWTGFDYLGEPTPYTNNWPSHSSYFGILDLAGIPKDRYYSFQSQWSGKPVLHVLPHWNWEGREGEITPVHVYTSYDCVELFLNGKSQGIRKKEATQKYGRYRLTWDSIRYEPGEIKVIAYDKKEKVAMTAIKRTAGTPYQIKLIADRSSLHATGNDLSFVTVQVLDKDGNLCPLASDNIQFQIKGAGLVRGVANGDPTNIQSLAGSEMQAFHGQCVVVIQSGEKQGSITLTASSPKLKSATLYLNVNQQVCNHCSLAYVKIIE